MSPTFADLGVPAPLVNRLKQRGITEAFPIQEVSIPDALQGIDVVGKAATGSGKTLAFGLPLLARTPHAEPRKPRGLVIVPTRELAAQVQKELSQLTEDRGRRIISIYGGTSYHAARKALNHGVDIIVACPGRLEDMLEQGALSLGQVETVVLDEADRMADMGFMPSVRRLIGATSERRHVMLFSATMGPDVASLVKQFTRDAVVHDVVGEESPSDVDHFFWSVPRDQRSQAAADIVNQYGTAIIFTRTKHGADRLARQLGERGLSAVPLHGDRSQAQRERALRSVKSGQIQVLVATDVAARGIHIDNLPVVIHFDPPAHATDYLHRSGRTGRAGATGAVISLVTEDNRSVISRMQRALGLTPGAEAPEAAIAHRLGGVDDAVAAESLDEPKGKSRGRAFGHERSAGRDRAPRGRFAEERGPRPERASRDRFSEERGPRAPRPERASRDRFSEERGPRERFNERGPRENARGPRQERGERVRTNADATSGRSDQHATVSFFNDKKGFGFASDNRGDDLFIHFSQIVGDGFKTLSEGQTIIFDEASGPKGREARNVRVLTESRRRRER